PYRDGSYACYIGEKVVSDDPKGVGAFILASSEMEHAADAKFGRGKTVLLDAWFNSQRHADAFGRQVYFHYKWDDMADSGYSLLAHIVHNYGAHTATLFAEPTADA